MRCLTSIRSPDQSYSGFSKTHRIDNNGMRGFTTYKQINQQPPI